MSFPLIILALTLLTALQRSLATVIVAIGVPFIPYARCSFSASRLIQVIVAIGVPFIPYGARVVRASALVIKEIQFIEAVRAIGCSDLRIIARHIAPSSVSLYLILTTGFIGVAIITESALGFLGLSIPPPTLPWVGCFPKPWLSSCSPRTWPLLQGYSSHWPCSRSMSLEMLCVTYSIHVYTGEARRGGRRNMRLSPSALGEETRGLSCSV
jgi:hypothetical protein